MSDIRIPDTSASSYRYVYYTYDNNRLTGVRYSELGGTAPHTTYTYDGTTNMLVTARNYDGVRVNVGYEATTLYDESTIMDGITAQMRRVLSLETVATNSSGAVIKYGAKQLFEYKHMCTEVTAVENSASDVGKKLYYQFNDSGNVVCVRDELGYAKFTKFESGLENKPSEESRLRKVVVNLLRRPDLTEPGSEDPESGEPESEESEKIWDMDTNTILDTAERCLNAPSVKLTAKAGESRCRQEVTLKAQTSYTFSAYVKTSEVVGDGAFLRLSKKTDTNVYVVSEKLTGTTEAATGNELASDGWERIRVTVEHSAAADEA